MNDKKYIRRSFGEIPAISLFTLGTMRAIGSSEEMYEVIKAACFAGINHIETSPAYGNAESFIGIALKKLRQENIEPQNDWVITSKILPGITVSEGKEQIRRILSQLGRRKIENLAIHGLNLPIHLDWVVHGEGKDLFNWAIKENLIKQIGFSSHGSSTLIENAIESNLFKFCSLHLHLLDQERIPLAKLALKKRMGVMAISPADKGGRLYDPSQTLLDICHPITPLELAYRFLIAQKISTLTLGAKQPKDLFHAKRLINANGPLNDSEISSINRLQTEGKYRLGSTMCGQCKECLPCPKNIPINEILRLRNLAVGYDLKTFAKERYNLIGRADHWWETVNASACESCGDCLPRCPNQLNIPELLKETHSLLIDKPRRRLWD